jgi:fumarate hydratase class II
MRSLQYVMRSWQANWMINFHWLFGKRAGTQSNMNVNEVVANRAQVLAGHKLVKVNLC